MRILRLSPSHPTSSSFDAFGITLTEILQEGIRGGHSKWSFGGSMSNRRAVFGVGLVGSPMVRLPKLWQFTGAGHCFWEYHEHMRFGLLILCLLLTGTSIACSQDDLRRDIRLIRRAFLDVTGLVPTESEIDWFVVYERTGYPAAVEYLIKNGKKREFSREILLSDAYLRQEERPLDRVELQRNVLYLAGMLTGGGTELSEELFQKGAQKFIADCLEWTNSRVGDAISLMVMSLTCRPCTAEEETSLVRIFNQVSLKADEFGAYSTVLMHIFEMHDCKFK